MISPGFDAAWAATWPAAEYVLAGGLVVGRGGGGGGRVSCARRLEADGLQPGGDIGADVDAAEARHRAWGQPALFAVEREDAALAHALRRRGYTETEPTLILSSPVAPLCEPEIPRVTAMELWPPLAIQRELWMACDVGPERQGVMERVQTPKAAIIGRMDDRAAGACFVAAQGEVAMMHALAVLPQWRGRGLGAWMVRRAAQFARAQGAVQLGLSVTEDNAVARAFYARLGFSEIGGYSYWRRE
ncbi:GNAT family N-acetyltransferase [Paracoccus alkenifer]|uniref:Acetyltransferase (GNAT) family protein n=1 Tax=Paracoccus alkenifer TaxID=65735 RepID=A0A1H6LHV5_9RHOB|nr:GNAT family N-acetyltransferase [Paracoccus alkenifer]SEH84356.1 Acetyltransferase (GNAT) family protein [Paracoccus alkenifer]